MAEEQMEYRRLGIAGLKVSALSFGSWLTFSDRFDAESALQCMRFAFDRGINFFDNAETYGKGRAETLMGKAVKEFRRESLIISTKIYFGAEGDGPNDRGLSWKHLVEGTKASLRRLDLEYVDLLYCHRPDPEVPVAETVRAMDHLIRSGLAFYWGTSEWPAEAILEAFRIAEKYNCIPPTMEQPQYNLLHRQRLEVEYRPVFERYGLGTTTWSPLAYGILTGKYNDGIPAGSRLEQHEWLRSRLTDETVGRVSKLVAIANRLDCSPSQLALAWCLKNPNVSTVIVGASSLKQLEENLGALDVLSRLDDGILQEIDRLFPQDLAERFKRE